MRCVGRIGDHYTFVNSARLWNDAASAAADSTTTQGGIVTEHEDKMLAGKAGPVNTSVERSRDN